MNTRDYSQSGVGRGALGPLHALDCLLPIPQACLWDQLERNMAFLTIVCLEEMDDMEKNLKPVSHAPPLGPGWEALGFPVPRRTQAQVLARPPLSL